LEWGDLRSFYIHAALGIVFVFLYMITFFFGLFYFDQRRIESGQNFAICCYRHKEYIPNACSQKSVQKMLFQKLAALLAKWPAKLVVIIVTVRISLFHIIPLLMTTIFQLGMLGGTIYGALQLETYVQYIWFFKKGTYVREFLELRESHFSKASGTSGNVYIKSTDFAANMGNVKDIIEVN
jgi:hypothetical protein